MLDSRFVRHRRPLIVALHLVLIPVGYLTAFALRFDLPVPEQWMGMFWATMPMLLVIRMASFAAFRLFQGWWRHAGMADLVCIVKAVSLSSGLFLAALFFVEPATALPRSIVALDWGLSLLIFGGARFTVRSFREGFVQWRAGTHGTPTLVIGAGEGGEGLIRQTRRDDQQGLRIVGLVDDDPLKKGMDLHGVRVLGTTAELESLIGRTGARLLVIAIPSASRETMQRMIERCMNTGVAFKIVPSLRELVDGHAKLSQVRDVQIEDLLGREPVQLDMELVERDLEGKVVMVTGGAGSIGSELARQVSALNPRRLVLFDQAESPLYYIHLEIRQKFPQLDVVPVVGDITDVRRIERAFSEHRPDYVFHAAAYKHVPLMEANLVEAVRNNVLGTLRVAECAAQYGVDKFVLISTDKAVNPSSVMGATKRIAERIVLGWPGLRDSGTDFRAVRFGNVLGSDGSVVPLFKRQILAGEPLTVTHPEVTRYFMTIPEAVQLVLQAGALPEARRRVCMLDMGQPVRIVDLAENLIRLSGLEPYKDVPIIFSGLRPGEKLHEELMAATEGVIATSVPKIRVVQTPESGGAALQSRLDSLLAALEIGGRDDLLLGICAAVPECVNPLRGQAVQAAGKSVIPLETPSAGAAG